MLARQALVVGIAITATLGGCTLLVSLSDLTGGGAVADAGSDIAVMEGAPDAAVNAPSDAGDARDDAPLLDADATTVAFCTPDGALFCDDFDVGKLGDRWSRIIQTNGTIGLDDAAVRSPPFAYLSNLTGGEEGGQATLLETLVLPASEVHVAVDIRVDAIGSPVDILQIVMTASDSGASYTVVFVAGPTESLVEESVDGSPGRTVPASKRVLVETWTRLHLDLVIPSQPDASAVVPILQVRYDDDPTPIYQAVPYGGPTGARGVTVQLGAFQRGSISPAHIRFDNLTIDAR